MFAIARTRLVTVILVILLLCTSVPSTTSCGPDAGIAVAAVVIVIAWLIYEVDRSLNKMEMPIFIACVDPHSASTTTIPTDLVDERQDLVISNELDCAYDVHVDGVYRCTMDPLNTTSLTVGVGRHAMALYRRAELDRSPVGPPEVHQEFEVLDECGLAYAVIQYSD